MQIHRLCLCVSAAAAGALLARGTSAQTLVRSVTGSMAGSQCGKACIVIPDQNADGFEDLLVGAPGFSLERGAVHCFSGGYLATGAGAQMLWTVAPSANPGDHFGFTIADVGDVTGDGIRDYLIGQPGYDLVGANDAGVIRLMSGSSSHTVISLIVGGVSPADFGAGSLFGSAIAACGDVNGDGISEVVIGAPGTPTCYARVLDGSSLTTGGSSLAGSMITWIGAGGNSGLGSAIVSGFDLDGDGYQEFACSSPGFDGPAGVDTGVFDLREASPGFPSVSYYLSTIPNERMGQSLDAADDYDGDGVIDIVAGAPNWPNPGTVNQLGRAVVLSGAKLLAHTPPYEIRTFTTLPNFGFLASNFHFGAAVRASRDLNGDGVGEILVGAPDYTSSALTGPARGFVSVYSGATGVQLAKVVGANNEHLGDCVTGAFEDLDGDGFDEFVVAGSLSDTGGTDMGIVKCYQLFPLTPAIYCTGKVNSLGCTPAIGSSGSASASSLAPFSITASSVINQKSGLLFYSHAPLAAPFQGGTKCVADPVVRTPVQSSGGSASGADCTGAYSLDFNAHIQSGVDPSLVTGAEVFAQYWARDPQSASTTSLSDALRCVINP